MTLTVAAAVAGFVVGAVVPSDRVLVGAAVATLLVIILQVIFTLAERGEQSSSGAIPKRKLHD